jgi:uncharacterized protein
LFVHWEVPVEVLRTLVPPPLSIDVFEGRAYVGLVPFTMHDVRFGPLPVRDFLETNLRTYVHVAGVPGVWFFSLDAQSRIAIWGARAFYGLPYFRARMQCASRDGYEYQTQREDGAARLDVSWQVVDEKDHEAEPGTLEHFLTERYALYGPRRMGGAYRVRVHHRAWPLRHARLGRLETNIPQEAGIGVADPIDLVLGSIEGVAVETFARERAGDSL